MNWTDEQLNAINLDNTNIIVSAGAGSGKTAVLSERVLRKVMDGVHVDSLLILTFTNAAAKEMKDRIRRKLIKNKLDDEVVRLDKAYITTFDSFALSTVKKYHDILNISDLITISDEVIIDLKKDEVLDKILEDNYKDPSLEFSKFIKDFSLKDDKLLRKSILKLDKVLDMRYDKEEYLSNYILNYYSDTYIDEMVNEYLDFINDKVEVLRTLLKDLELALDGEEFAKFYLFETMINSNSYDDIVKYLDTKLPRANKNYTDEAKEYKEEFSNKLKELKNLIVYENVSSIKEAILSTKSNMDVLTSILLRLSREVSIIKEEEELYNFIDIFKLAIKLVSENSDVREEIKSSFNEILMDEYQDNNDLQELFISYIENNNLYMVGDIKQSIYRFRNANPNIFKNKYDSYLNTDCGEKIDLNQNFRSRNKVLDDINLIFNDLMDLEVGGADYKESHQMIFGNKTYIEKGSSSENYNLDIYKYEVSEDKNISKEEQEIFIIARDIKEKIKSGFKIFDKDLGALRNIDYSDIVILLDKTKYFDLYKKIFEYLEIPLSVYKDESVKSSSDIFIINNLLKLIFHIKDNSFDTEFKYAFTSVARSYLFRLSDEEIFDCFTNNKFRDNLIYNKALNISLIIDTIDAPSVFLKIIEEFNIEDKFITTGNVGVSSIRLEYFYNLLLNMSSSGNTIYDFSKYLDNLYNLDYDSKFSVNKEEENSTKIMTIHKSKGLEFPLCYFASFKSKFNLRDLNETFLYDNTYNLVIPSVEEMIKPTIYKELLRNKSIKEEIGEKIRLLYVALTRSCEKMIMVIPEEEFIKKDIEKCRSFLDFIGNVYDRVSHYVKVVDSFVTKEYLYNSKKSDLESLKINDSFEVNENSYDTSIVSTKRFSKDSIHLVTKSEQELLDFGNNIHEILEYIDYNNLDNLNIDDSIKSKILNFFNLDIIKDSIKSNHKFYHEYEFMYQGDDTLEHGIIDLLIDRGDDLLIIDFKLKNIDDNKYIEQLNGYKKVIEAKTKRKVSCYLYSVLNSELKVL